MRKAPKVTMVAVLAGVLLLVVGCHRVPPGGEQCQACHGGLEIVSTSHSGCVSCHGGDRDATTKEAGHNGLYDLAEASQPGLGEAGCATCHRHKFERMQSSQMFTNAGMIAQIQATWEGARDSIVFAAHAGQVHNASGLPLTLASVSQLTNLSGELYRKFCATCHLGQSNAATDGGGHGSGCAACHFPYADDAVYRGRDGTMHGQSPHSQTHTMAGLPPMAACTRCHQRSGRVALAYQGLNDGNNGLVPTHKGMPGPVPASDGRSYSHITPDVHFAAGMECIDCHTSREVMGEGYTADGMHGQLEIGCEDCHGDGAQAPRFAAVWREQELPLRESRQYPRRIVPGTRMALTRRGRPYSNVYADSGQVSVLLKRDGRVLRSPVITGTPAHDIAGHERMECYACHSHTVVQCFGCHTAYDLQEYAWDPIVGRATPGAFSETEDVRSLYPFPLALNTRGRVSTVTPGCQTFITVIDEKGNRVRDEEVARFRGKRQLRFAPFFGHNIGTRAVSCAECHGNPAFLGFGQHVIERGSLRPTLLCSLNDQKPLDGFLAEDRGVITAHAAMSRAGARPLDAGEVKRVLAVNLCLICHDQATDPIYRAPLEYHALDDSLHQRLLAVER